MSWEKHGLCQAPAGCRVAFDLCYVGRMSHEPKTLDRMPPSAAPSEEDARAWEALPREEQLRLLRAALKHPDCSTVSAAAMSQILAEARRQADARSRG
jgi:hypothetical protein